MASHQLRKIIFGLTAVWFVLGLVFAAAVMAQWIDKDLFTKLFIGGFVVYCVIVALLSSLLSGIAEQEQEQDSDEQ